MGNSRSKMDGCCVCMLACVCRYDFYTLLKPKEFEFIYILEKEIITEQMNKQYKERG